MVKRKESIKNYGKKEQDDIRTYWKKGDAFYNALALVEKKDYRGARDAYEKSADLRTQLAKHGYTKDSRITDFTEQHLAADGYLRAAKLSEKIRDPKKASELYRKAASKFDSLYKQIKRIDKDYISDEHSGLINNLKSKVKKLRRKAARREKIRSLVGKLRVAAVIFGFIGAGFFLLNGITGHVISNLTNQTSSIIGGALFVIVIIGSYFWFKRK